MELFARFGAVEVHKHRKPFRVVHHHLAQTLHTIARCEILQMQHIVGNVSGINRISHRVVKVHVFILVKRGRKHQCFGAGYGIQLLSIRFGGIFQMVGLVVKLECVLPWRHVCYTRCHTDDDLKRVIVWLAVFQCAFPDKQHIQLSLKYISKLFCQIYPRTEHTKEM